MGLWDQLSDKERARQQNVLLRQTVLQMALGHVPFVRARLAAIGMDARLFKGMDEMTRLPLTMRRDVVDPARNPEGTRALILRGTAEGVKRFSDRRTLRRVALARLLGGEDVQELAIEAATRAIHIHLVPGPGGRLPVAYTRDDLDLLARAGARLGSVVGVAREDRLLNAIPFGPTLDFWGVFYMAHGLGMSALHVRREAQDLARALAAFDDGRATVVALGADEAAAFPDAAAAAGIDLSELRMLLAVGRSLTTEERATVGDGLARAGAAAARIAAAYGPMEGRVLWGECGVPAGRTETFGFHVYPDMDIVEIVSPEDGAVLSERVPGEIVVTPLGFRGGGAPRWRTGDLALGGLTTEPCPNCGRVVPRVGPTVRRNAWQQILSRNGRRSWVDLRDVGAAAAERAARWQVELVRASGGDDLYVYLEAGEDPEPLIDLYEELGRLRASPSQIVLVDDGAIEERLASATSAWGRLAVRDASDESTPQ